MSAGIKTVCFRTKGNHKQGVGDLLGSIALAEEFRRRGHRVCFVVDADKECLEYLKKNDFQFIPVKNGNEKKSWQKRYFDIAVVNQMNSSKEQLALIRNCCRRLVTIDDTSCGSRKFADLRINPLYYGKGAICGSRYVPLDKAFQQAHSRKKIIREYIRHVLVTMGGSDTYGLTPQIVRALKGYPEDIKITVIAGYAFRHKQELARQLSAIKRKFRILKAVNAKTMCRLMQQADLAICGGGNTLFEMASCGTPVIIVCAEKFEEETVFRFKKLGFGKVIPFNKKLNRKRLKKILQELTGRGVRRRQSCCGKMLVDGRGTRRIYEEIIKDN